MNACDDRCDDAAMHAFYWDGGNFRWCWPKVNRLHAADRHIGFVLNRYPHNVIGVAFYLGRRGVGLRWKRGGR